MQHKITIILTLFISLMIASCKPDEDLITPDLKLIQKVKSTEILLRNNTWTFNDLVVTVKYEMKAIPLLANVADENGMVQPGEYNALQIFGNDHRQQYYSYQFSTININKDTTNTNQFNSIGYYNVLNSREIRVNHDSTGFDIYKYNYQDEEGLFTITSDQLTNSKINELANKMITDAISSGKPNDIANKVVDKILGNEGIQATIQQLLYDLIHNKIDQIVQNPEEISQKLASLIVQKLKEVDWETLVYNKLVEILDELKVENPEQKAQELAVQIANRIETNISQSDIYYAILPILKKFEDETLPKLVPVVAEAIYGVISMAFTEENIYNKIYPLWVKFSEVDSSKVSMVADTLGTVITNHFFELDALSSSLEPFIALLRSTPTSKIPALAQDIIDNILKPKVDSINANFPALELNPDWNNVKTILTSALTAIKASIGNQTDEQAADALATSIIGIMDLTITTGFEKAIFYLQGIPADQASQVIAAWISNLVTIAEPEIVEFLTAKLNELAELFNAEDVAEQLSAKIHDKILEVFSADNIYNIILPVLEQINDINVENVAQIITDWLFDLNLIKDNITEEQVLEALTNIISQLIGNINVDDATQKLVDLILQSNFIKNIDGKVLKQLLEIKIYSLLIDLGKHVNSIEKVEFSMKIK